MGRVKRSVQARRDLIQIWVYIGENSISTADDLLDSIKHKSAFLSDWPGAGAMRDDLAIGLRSFPVGNYILLYRECPGGIELVRVVHGARNLRKLFRQRG